MADEPNNDEVRAAYEATTRPRPEHPDLGKLGTGDKQCAYCDTMTAGRHKGKIVHENLAHYGASTGTCTECHARFNRLRRRYGAMRALTIMGEHSPEGRRQQAARKQKGKP